MMKILKSQLDRYVARIEADVRLDIRDMGEWRVLKHILRLWKNHLA
jgi:hypothetical protein